MTDLDALIRNLEASLRFDAINGDAHERAVVVSQVRQAAAALRELREERDTLQAKLTAAVAALLELLTRIRPWIDKDGTHSGEGVELDLHPDMVCPECRIVADIDAALAAQEQGNR
jgi:hypothetical protein